MTARVPRAVPARAPEPLALIQAFINTDQVEARVDDLATPALAGRWLAGHGLCGVDPGPDVRDLARLIAVREGLRALCTPGPVDAAAVDDLREAVARVDLRTAVAADGRLRLASEDGGVDGAIAALLAIVYEAQRDGTWMRLKVCGDHRCGWAFYDLSRSRSATWCAMAVCGNRTKVAAYRGRMNAAHGSQIPA